MGGKQTKKNNQNLTFSKYYNKTTTYTCFDTTTKPDSLKTVFVEKNMLGKP